MHPVILPYLTALIASSYSGGSFPGCLKKPARVTLLFKKTQCFRLAIFDQYKSCQWLAKPSNGLGIPGCIALKTNNSLKNNNSVFELDVV